MTAGDTMRDGRRGGTTFSLAISVVAITLVTRTDSVRATEDPAALTYLPARNEFAGSTQYIFVNSTGDVSSASASPSYSYSLHTQVISQSLSYGFTDALRLSIALAHSYVDSRYDFESVDYSAARHSEGSAYLSVTYRLLKQSSQPFNLDLSVGNTGASTAVSYEAGDFAILARAGVYRARGGMGFDPVQNVDLTISETWGYTAELRSQFRLSRRWSVNLGAAYSSSPFSGSNTASIGDSSFQLKRPDAVSVGLAAIYHIVPNRFSVQLGYQHIFIGQRRDEYADSTRNVVAGNQRADSFGLALIYRF
jgi:hypothetical protein